MKTLKNVKTTVSNGKVTMTADIVDCPENFRVQQQTIIYVNPANIRHPRHIQISHEAVLVKSASGGFVMYHDDLVNLATLIEPKTSYAPVFSALTQGDQDLTVQVGSELTPDLQWQVSDDIGKSAVWSDVTGATGNALEKSKVKSGQFVRCKASSEAGIMFSSVTQVK